jgi:IS1 family transposase
VALVVGKRTQKQTQALVQNAKDRLRPGHLPALLTDAYDGYESAILAAFGRQYPAPKTHTKGRPALPVLRWPQGLAYGQVNKSAKGHSEGIALKVVRGKAHLQRVLGVLGYHKINTSVVERHNGTSRLRNQRKVRRTLAFSKMTRYHRWMSWLSVVQYHFCWAHGSLKVKHDTRMEQRSPAMAAGLTGRIWSAREWLLTPVLGGQE